MWLNPRHRYLRLLRTLSRRWQRWAIFTGGAPIVGLAAVGPARAADMATHDFQRIVRMYLTSRLG